MTNLEFLPSKNLTVDELLQHWAIEYLTAIDSDDPEKVAEARKDYVDKDGKNDKIDSQVEFIEDLVDFNEDDPTPGREDVIIQAHIALGRMLVGKSFPVSL